MLLGSCKIWVREECELLVWLKVTVEQGRTRYNEALKNKYGDLNGDIFNDG